MFFFDECIEYGDKLFYEPALDNVTFGIKVIRFPQKLKGASDETVLRLVMDFIRDNPILLKRGVKIYLYSRDWKFDRDSDYEEIFKEYGFTIKLFIISFSQILVREMNAEFAESLVKKVI